MQAVRARLGALGRVAHVQQVSVDVVLQHKLARVEPVVKDLAAHDVPPDAPAVLVALVPQPVVAEDLCVVVVRLETAVVDVRRERALEEEEAVVVDLLAALVEPEKDGLVLARLVVHQLRGVEVEVGRVEVEAALEVGHARAVVAQLVHRRRSLLEPLRLVDAAVLLLGLVKSKVRNLSSALSPPDLRLRLHPSSDIQTEPVTGQ